MLKIAMKAIIATVAVGAFVAPAFAYTLTGNVPGNNRNGVQVNLQKPIPTTGYLKFTLKIPQATSGAIGYAVGLCVGRNANACGTAEVAIPGGEQVVVIYDANTFPSSGFWLRTGLGNAVPYVLDVDHIP
jgi:hypothetical protein